MIDATTLEQPTASIPVNHPQWCEQRRFCELRDAQPGSFAGYHSGVERSVGDGDEVSVAVVAYQNYDDAAAQVPQIRVRAIEGVDAFTEAVLSPASARQLLETLAGAIHEAELVAGKHSERVRIV